MRVIDYVAPPKADHWWIAKPRPALRALELRPPTTLNNHDQPHDIILHARRGTITEPFCGGTRLEKAMITTALTGSGRLAIEMRIIGPNQNQNCGKQLEDSSIRGSVTPRF